jgi:hypothetical protein
MGDIEWLGAHMRVFQKAAELRPFNLLEGLITGDDPFCYILLECLEVKCLFLAALLNKKSDKTKHYSPYSVATALQTWIASFRMSFQLLLDRYLLPLRQILLWQMQLQALRRLTGRFDLSE